MDMEEIINEHIMIWYWVDKWVKEAKKEESDSNKENNFIEKMSSRLYCS